MGGDIVYISSKNSVFAGPNNIAYSATKADQAHQVRLLAAELGEHGVKVNGVNPDGVVAGLGHLRLRLGRQPRRGLRRGGEGPRQVLRPAHDPQARGAAREHRQRRLRALRPRHDPHHRACTSPSTPASRRPSCDEPDPARRRRRPGRHQRPGRWRATVGPRRRASSSSEVHRFPNGAVPVARLAVLGRLGIHREVLDRAARGRPRPARCTASASTPGPSTTACSTATATLLGNPYSHRDRRTDGVRRAGAARRSPAERAVRHHRPAAAALQHASTSSSPRAAPPRWSRPRRCCCCPTCSATGSPARSAPSAPTPPPPSSTTSRPASGPVDLASRVGVPWAILPPLRDPGDRVGWVRPDVASALDLAADVPVIAVGSHDTASAVVGVPADRGDTSPTSPRAPGRWSAWSSTRRCSPRRPGWPTSPTRAASTAPSGSSRT